MELLSNILSTDVAVLVAMVCVLVAYGAVFGTALVLRVIVALPIAAFLYGVFPYTHTLVEQFATLPEWLVPFVLFALLVAVGVWALTRIVGDGYGNKRPVHILVVALVCTMLLLAIAHALLPIESLYTFGDQLHAFFASPATLFWGTAIGLLALFAI